MYLFMLKVCDEKINNTLYKCLILLYFTHPTGLDVDLLQIEILWRENWSSFLLH